jgi:hypothetical protein
MGEARGLEHRRRVLRARDDGDLVACALYGVEEGDAPGVGRDALFGEGRVERLVLAIAEAVHGIGGRGIRRRAFRHADAAALEEAPNAVVPGLAVDVGEVVVVGIRRDAVRLENRREQSRPRVHVHDGGRREHAVEVEKIAADAGEIDGSSV